MIIIIIILTFLNICIIIFAYFYAVCMLLPEYESNVMNNVFLTTVIQEWTARCASHRKD